MSARWIRASILAAILGSSLDLFATSFTTYTYVGKNGTFGVASNWAENAYPVSDSILTQLVFSGSYPSSFVDIPDGFRVAQMQFTGSGIKYGIGASTLYLGFGGLNVASGALPTSVYLGASTVYLDATQTWNTGTGSITFEGSLQSSTPGAYGLTKTGSGSLRLYGDNSSFSGAISLLAGTTSISASSGLGTGAVTLASGATLAVTPFSKEPTIVLPNNFTVGSTTGSPVTFGITSVNNYSSGNLSLTGSLTANVTNTIVSLTDNLTLYIQGLVDATNTGTALTFGAAAGNTTYGVAVFYDPTATSGSSTKISSKISSITADAAAVVFADTSLASNTGFTIQATNKGAIGVAGEYLSSIDTNALLSWVLGRITDKANFYGMLSLDTKPYSLSISSYTGDPTTHLIDLSGFSPTTFTLGSMTNGKIDATVILAPPGSSVSGTTVTGGSHYFGNGGGRLEVATVLSGSGLSLVSDAQCPLTLILSGANTYTGNATVVHSMLVADNALAIPSTTKVNLGDTGYFSLTTAAVGSTSIDPSLVLANLGTYTATSIVGVDNRAFLTGTLSLSGNLDLSGLSTSVYFGTMTGNGTTGLTIPSASTVKAKDGLLKLVALGGRDQGSERGTMIIEAALSSANITSVVFGHTDHQITFGKNDTPGVYILSGLNTYTGGTTINGGDFQLGSISPFGTGTVSITNLAEKVGLAPTIAEITLPSIDAQNSVLILGNSSTATNKLSIPSISGTALVRVVGNTCFTGANTFTGGLEITSTGSITASSNTATGTNTIAMESGSSLTFDNNALAPILGTLKGSGAIILDASATDLTINQKGNTYFSGLISAAANAYTAAQLSINNDSITSSLTLGTTDQNYSGGTVVNNGSLIIEGTAGVTTPLGKATGSITLNNANLNLAPTGSQSSLVTPVVPNTIVFGTGSNTLSGTGSFANATTALVINTGVTLSPGTYSSYVAYSGAAFVKPGLLVFETAPLGVYESPSQSLKSLGSSSTLTLASGGTFDLVISNPGAAAGTGYSAISVDGTVDITSTSSSPFVFNVISTDASGSLGPIADLTPGYTYTMTVISTTGGVTFNGSQVLDSSGLSLQFANFTSSSYIVANNWSFALSGDSKSLLLNFTPVPEPETWALMLSGSALLLTASLRRKIQALMRSFLHF